MDVANHSCLSCTETVFPRLSRHTVFLNSTKLFILWKCKNLKRFFFPCRIVHSIWATKKRALISLTFFLRAFRHLETLCILSLVFIQTGNRKSELCKASMASPSSETQGQRVGSIKCSWWKFSVRSTRLTAPGSPRMWLHWCRRMGKNFLPTLLLRSTWFISFSLSLKTT